jgi:hypothetical protein
LDLQTSCLSLVNALINGSDEVSVRINTRDEFIDLGIRRLLRVGSFLIVFSFF